MAALVSSQGWFVPVTTSQAFSLWDNQTYFWTVTFPGLEPGMACAYCDYKSGAAWLWLSSQTLIIH